MKLKYNFKNEELPPFGDFAGASFEVDRPHFINFSPEYGDGYYEHYNSMLQQVKDVINPKTLTSQMKQATEQLHNAENELKLMFDHIERYSEKAGKAISFKLNDLNMKGLRKKFRQLDAEGIVKGAQSIEQIIAPSLAVLTQKGYTPEQQARVSELIKTIETTNLLQDKLMNQRRRLVDENGQLLNDFWDILDDLMKTGKLIFKNNQVKKAEYTKSNVLKRIRMIRNSDDKQSKSSSGTKAE